MVSSEAKIFQKYGQMLDSDFLNHGNLFSAEKLNRKCAIRAILWHLIKEKNFQYNPEVIFETANLGELDGSRREFYEFLFGKEYPYSEMTINNRSDENFFQALLQDIQYAEPKYTKPFRDAYKYVKSFLPTDKPHKIVIVDVGWGGTVQVLFSQFAKLNGHHAEIEGLYLGVMPGNRFNICEMPPMEGYLMPDVKYGKDRSLFCAVLWEYPYTNKPQFSGDVAHLEQIHIGLERGLKIFLATRSAPKPYFDQIVRKEIRRFVSNPTKSEARTIGSINFDMGFAKPMSFQIVSMQYTHKQVLKMLLCHPKRTVHQIIFERNHWSGGFIKYYHLPIIKILVKIYGRLVKKTLI